MTDDPTAAGGDLLRFIACGSVDDGKSTLIGRLLFDTHAILADALASIRRVSERRGGEALDLSLLTDGLQAEREQGITVDVAYRYFATGRRRFILGDTPGHEQYTRNMVTAASTADLAVILVDARKGVVAQTRRHAALAHLLGIRQLVVAVNKMDLVNGSERAFEAIRRDCLAFAGELGMPPMAFVPISAMGGDMVVARGARLPWYAGPTLLELLEAAPADHQDPDRPLRFPVQWICRPVPGSSGGARGYAGRIEAGSLQAGAPVLALPGGRRSRVRAIRLGGTVLPAARAGQSVTLELEDDLDLGRGDLLADPARPPAQGRCLEATLCLLAEAPVRAGARLLLQAGTREVRTLLQTIHSRLDLTALRGRPADQLEMNDIADVRLRLQADLPADPYGQDRATGAFILVDEATQATVAGGMVRTVAAA
jgi:sulfate adenylyltransferase subunit 1